VVGSNLQLIQGAHQRAYTDAMAVFERVEPIKVAASARSASVTKNNVLRGTLNTASAAAIRLGHYAQAEALARKWQSVPRDPTSDSDPKERNSRNAALLAQASVMQDRIDEARSTQESALTYYRQEQQAGARGTSFRYDFAYALYVSALARPANVEGHAQRNADLAEAAKMIDGASAEARRMATFRELTNWISSARAS